MGEPHGAKHFLHSRSVWRVQSIVPKLPVVGRAQSHQISNGINLRDQCLVREVRHVSDVAHLDVFVILADGTLLRASVFPVRFAGKLSDGAIS